MTVRIEVTAEDIAKGKKFDCEECPIALAMKRVLPGAVVHSATVSVASKGWCLMLPVLAMDFNEKFDYGHAVAPFSFDLEIPEGRGPWKALRG